MAGTPAPVEKVKNKKTTVAGYTFELKFEEEPPAAGHPHKARMTVTGPDGKPFAKLEPVMGAFAHLVGFSEDRTEIAHIHPLGQEPGTAAERGGPTLEFQTDFATGGYQKLFAQVQIDGRPLFAPFGIDVTPAKPDKTASAAEHEQHNGHDEPAAIPATVTEILAAVDQRVAAIDQAIAGGNLAKVHGEAFVARDLLAALPEKVASLNEAETKALDAAIGRIRQQAGLLDKFGDAGDAAQTRAVLARFKTEIAGIRQQVAGKSEPLTRLSDAPRVSGGGDGAHPIPHSLCRPGSPRGGDRAAMIKQLIHFSIKNRLFVLAAAFALTLYGLYEMARLPVDVLPDLNRPQVTVLTEAEGLAPEEVETLVTFPIETALNGSTGVQRVRSVSAVGLSIVFVEFDWGKDIYLARQLVGEKLATTRDRLPAGIEPRMGPISSIMGEIMLIGLKSQTIPPVQLRLLADWTVRPRLLSIPGVANAIPIGGGRMQYQVQVDAEKLRAYDLTLEEVERAVANANENSTGGFIEKQSQEFLVRNLGRIRNIAEFADAVVTTRAGTPITVGNVARVLEGIQVQRGDASIDGEPGVIVMVSKQPGQDTVALTRTIEKAMAELRAALPPGVKLDDDVFRQQHFIEASIHNVIEVMRDAAILVTLVLVLFLLNTRTTLISLVAIPLSFIVTFIVFGFAGIGINTMTLGGLAIAIGELVDDSIIDIENVFRRLRENAARPAEQRLNPLRVIYHASNEVRSTLVYATILMVIVFIPLFQLSGIEGRIFAPMGIAYIVSVLASLVVSLTVTPALAAVLLSRYFDDIRVRLEARGLVFHGGEAADSWIVRQLKAIDRVQLGFTLRYPTLVMGAFYGLALVALAAATQLGREFLPPFNEGTITVTLIAAPGTSLSESNRIGALAEKELLAIGEVALVSRRTGRAELDEHAEGVHSSELEVDFKPGGRPSRRYSPRSASGSAAFPAWSSTSASPSRTGSTTCCPASTPKSPSRCSATIWRRCGQRRRRRARRWRRCPA